MARTSLLTLGYIPILGKIIYHNRNPTTGVMPCSTTDLPPWCCTMIFHVQPLTIFNHWFTMFNHWFTIFNHWFTMIFHHHLNSRPVATSHWVPDLAGVHHNGRAVASPNPWVVEHHHLNAPQRRSQDVMVCPFHGDLKLWQQPTMVSQSQFHDQQYLPSHHMTNNQSERTMGG